MNDDGEDSLAKDTLYRKRDSYEDDADQDDDSYEPEERSSYRTTHNSGKDSYAEKDEDSYAEEDEGSYAEKDKGSYAEEDEDSYPKEESDRTRDSYEGNVDKEDDSVCKLKIT